MTPAWRNRWVPWGPHCRRAQHSCLYPAPIPTPCVVGLLTTQTVSCHRGSCVSMSAFFLPPTSTPAFPHWAPLPSHSHLCLGYPPEQGSQSNAHALTMQRKITPYWEWVNRYCLINPFPRLPVCTGCRSGEEKGGMTLWKRGEKDGIEGCDRRLRISFFLVATLPRTTPALTRALQLGAQH